MKCPHTIFQKEESSGEINKNYLKKSLTSLISTCYNAIRTLLNSAFLCVQKGAFEKKGGFAVKVRSSVKPICEEASELSVRIRNTNRDRVDLVLVIFVRMG